VDVGARAHNGIVALIGVNPFFPFYVSSPSMLRDIVNTFLFSIFTSSVFLSMLLMIASIPESQSPAPKSVFFTVQLILEIA
jgi:hypothetical protein